MEAIWRRKLATVIGSMIPSGVIVKTDFGDEKAIALQIRTDSDEFDAIVITNNQNEHQGVYRLEDVKPYLKTYGQLTESEMDHIDYLDDDREKSEISIALAYMKCVADRDGQNEFIKEGYALKAPRGMYEPVDWRAYYKELYGDDCYDDDDDEDEDEDGNINFSNDDLDDDDDYDEE